MKKMMMIILLGTLLISLAGCGAKGLDKLAACGECMQGLQELQNVQTLAPMLDKYKIPVE